MKRHALHRAMKCAYAEGAEIKRNQRCFRERQNNLAKEKVQSESESKFNYVIE